LAVAFSSYGQPLPCLDTNSSAVKFLLPPQIPTQPVNYGFDVKDSRDNILLADDFRCTNSGPITDIHVWASWQFDVPGNITNFVIGIYSDVPATTNLQGQITTNSHPGNLLWWTNFPQGKFTFGFYTNAFEYYLNPTNNQGGAESQVWYYCFFPTNNPFVQQGSPTAPTNYWLAMRAQVADPNTNIIYGWKSSAIPYGDPAVWIMTPSLPGPGAKWNSITNPETHLPLHLSMVLTTTNTPPPQQTQCVETNGVKYLQSPNFDYGLDVWNNPYVLADDFICTNSGPISDIHIWGSWLNNQVSLGAINFWVGIYDDVPMSITNVSHPGKLLWQQWFAPGQYAELFVGTGSETFIDPGPPVPLGPENQIWYYCFYPTNPLIQIGYPCAPKVYWLAAYAQLPGAVTNKYGWKSTFVVQNDASVYALWPGTPPTNNPGWIPTMETPSGPPLDLAFKITTATNYNYNNNLKYIQWPDTNVTGYDVWDSGPWVLADDFICTNTGYISDIHLWGSWLNDGWLTNSLTFWIGLFYDVPAYTNSSGQLVPSHPGSNFWSQCFAPGCYFETQWLPNGYEHFLDPAPALMGSDYTIWYYSFYPTNPPIQWGSSRSPRTYWVGAHAQLPVGVPYNFGWKTTTNVQHDVSVYSPWTFAQCPTNVQESAFGWLPTKDYNGRTLDLAFEVSTITNCSASFVMIDKDYVNKKVIVSWPSGILQWATKVDGPYVDVPGSPASPFQEPYFPLPINPTNHFYRVRCN
jgi:hypothetical protein